MTLPSASLRLPRRVGPGGPGARLAVCLVLALGAAGVPGTGAAQPAAASASPGAASRPVYSLAQLIEIARRESPALGVSRADELAARAGLVTARAYPNPELEFEGGSVRPTYSGNGSSSTIVIGQPIENPWLRDSRLKAAESGLEVARARTGALQANLNAELRRRYFEMVRQKEQLQAFRDDLLLTEQIRERVQLRVRSGEAPRFDLVRAESEMAVALKNVDASTLRLRAAASELRQIVSPALPDDFDVQVEPAELRPLEEGDYQAMKQALGERNPEVLVSRQEVGQAERQVALERDLVLPQVTLRAMQERDASITINRIGAALTVPLVNRREGPIQQAQAQAARARLALDQRRFEAQAALDAAWLSYRSALSRATALEGGILERARDVVGIAEAAYRYGERGILEFLDAQRQFRLVRNELIQARFELQSARSELDRLAGR
jgi:cobalt-zinc-cadmium efflux system outer membrane protein